MTIHVVLAAAEPADGWQTLARIVDVLGLIGFLIVAIGLLSAYLTRPRLRISGSAPDSGTILIVVQYVKGSHAANNLNVFYRGLGADGRGVDGDDSIWRRESFLPGSVQWILFQTVIPSGIQGSAESLRLQLGPEMGILISVTWDSALAPWRRTGKVVLWSRSDRASGSEPKLLKGRKATAAVTRSLLNPPMPASASG